MDHPGRLLTDGETAVLELHPHWRTVAAPIVFIPVLVAAASFVAAALPPGRWRGDERWAVLVAAAALLVRVSLRRWLRWQTTRYVVTTRRVMLRAGWLRHRGRDIPLNRISDVSFSQTLLDRLVRAGTLVIESTGEHGRVVIANVAEVESVQDTLYTLVQSAG